MSLFNPSDVNHKANGIKGKELRIVCQLLGAASEAANYQALYSDLASKLSPEHVQFLAALPWEDSDFIS